MKKVFGITFLGKKYANQVTRCSIFQENITPSPAFFRPEKVIKNILFDVKPRRTFFEIQMSFKTSFEWSFLKDFQITTFLDLMFNVSPPVGWLEFLWRLNITIIIIHTTWTLLYNSYNNIGLSGHFTKSIKTYGKAPIKQV